MKRLLPLLLILSLFLNACGQTTTTTIPTVVPTAIPSLKAGIYRESLSFEGLTRTYVVNLPSAISTAKALPLVIILHPATTNADLMAVLTGFNAKANKEGFIAVYPNGTGVSETTVSFFWNNYNCCSAAMKNHVNDVGFLKALLEKLEQTYPVDPKRIYLTGMSNGGMMTYLLGAELSGKFAALAPVVGAMSGKELKPTQPVSIIAFNGTADRVVPYNGLSGNVAALSDSISGEFKPVSYAVKFWVKSNSANGDPQKEDTPKYLKETYTGGKNGTVVVQYTIKEGGHTWYGGLENPKQTDNSGISATDLIWDFFKAHPKL